jgi:putative drug exporter of the RND superfamily
MSGFARWCARHRFVVLGGWVAAFALLVGLVVSMGSDFKTVGDLPDSESARAYATLGTSSDSGETGRIVWHSSAQPIDSAEVEREAAELLRAVSAQPGVVTVVSPYGSAESSQLSRDHDTAYALVTISADADAAAIRDKVDTFSTDDFQITMGGQAFAPETTPGGVAEIVGVLAALLILLLMFRSAWAAVLPIITGVTGVVVSLLFVMISSHAVNLASDSITMGSLIGLGVGIDYALFVVNRYRKALVAGASVEDAVVEAVNTSGRAVIFAGLTVAGALLSIVVVGMGVLTGMGRAAAVTVVFTVLAAISLLPALLSMLGVRVLSRKQRRVLATGALANDGRVRTTPASRWAGAITRAPRLSALTAVVVVAVLAIPALSMRVGEADSSSYPADSVAREYFEMTSPAFGKGLDATLLLVAKTPDSASVGAFSALADRLASVDDVASVSTPVKVGDGVELLQVTPASSAGAEATVDLVHHLRDDVIPSATGSSSLQVYVGGETATNIDVADALMSRLPLYLLVVALLGFLLLVLAFRSLLVPLIGALSNVATLIVALGVITAIFQWGWATEQLGVGEGAAISYIVPVMIVGVMFGLSMDYQVFLVSRMHEEWAGTRDNLRSIRVGIGETAKVIATAALIMLAVFSSFGFSGQRIVACIGIGLALAVLVDAFVVRLILVPAVMTLIGRRVWAFPAWLDRITPRVSVEGPGDSTGAATPAEGTMGEHDPDADRVAVGKA